MKYHDLFSLKNYKQYFKMPSAAVLIGALKVRYSVSIENKTQKQKRQMVSDKIWSIRTKYFHLT